MTSSRLVYFSSGLALLLFVACGGSDSKTSRASILRAPPASPAPHVKTCGTTDSGKATAADCTGTQKPAEPVKIMDVMLESDMMTQSMDAAKDCPSPFPTEAKLDDGDTKIELKDLVDQQDGSWQLATTEVWSQIEDTSKNTKVQLHGQADATQKVLALDDKVNKEVATVLCHTSGADLPAVTSGKDWSSISVPLSRPYQINRKDGTITRQRLDAWEADRGQVRSGTQLYKSSATIGSSPDTSVFPGLTSVLIGLSAHKDAVTIYETNVSLADTDHKVTTISKSVYHPATVANDQQAQGDDDKGGDQ